MQICTAYTVSIEIHKFFAYSPFLLLTINEAYNCVHPSEYYGALYPTNQAQIRGSRSCGPTAEEKSFRRSKGGAIPSPIVDVPNLAKKHCAEPDAGATPSLIVTFPCPAKEHPPTKAPRGRTPRNKQKADQQNNSFSVDPRSKSWGMPEVWAKVFHDWASNRHLMLKNIA